MGLLHRDPNAFHGDWLPKWLTHKRTNTWYGEPPPPARDAFAERRAHALRGESAKRANESRRIDPSFRTMSGLR